jgi:hypothetical protein
MKKGIVMEIDDAHLTLLTPEGEFLHALNRNQSYSIGEEIHFFPIEEIKRNSHFSIIKLVKMKSLVSVFAVLIVILGSFIPMYQANKAYAYMSIDVNPSIELGVNKKMQVVKISAFNNEGKKILSHINEWKKEGVLQLTQTILNEMKEQGYFREHHEVIISTVRTEKTEKRTEEKLTNNLHEIKEVVKEKHLQPTMLTGTKKDMEKAHHLGITTGKYQERKMDFPAENITKKSEQKNDRQKNNAAKSNLNQPKGQMKKDQDEKGTVNNHVQVGKERQSNLAGDKQVPPGQSKTTEKKTIDQKKQKQGFQDKREINNRKNNDRSNKWNSNQRGEQNEHKNEHEKNNEHK